MAELGRIDHLRHRAARFLPAAPVRIAPERGVFSLSFDDFPVSAWTEGRAILADQGVRATYYVAGGLCGGRNLDLPQFEVAHMQAARDAGHEIGCHTFEHVSVLAFSGRALRASLERNARWVAERLDGYAMQTFAYPFGDWSASAKRIVAKRFKAARGVRDGVNTGRCDRAGLVAIGLEARRLPAYDLEALAAQAAQSRGWLIAYGHDVSDNPTPYGCRPRDVERMIAAARGAGLDILPVGEAADWVSGKR